jgi:hypothetical protein
MIDLNVDVRKIATEQSKKTWYKILSLKPSGSEIPLPKDE